MNVACSSATFGLQAAADMVAAGHARAILVCNPEICSGHLNFRDRDSHFIFGDVATAFVVERAGDSRTAPMPGKSSRPDSRRSSRTTSATISASSIAPRRKASATPDKLFVQEGRKVFKEVVPMVSELIVAHLAENGIAPGLASSASGCTRPTST